MLPTFRHLTYKVREDHHKKYSLRVSKKTQKNKTKRNQNENSLETKFDTI